MKALPVPPIVEQNTALLPDGSIDPAHATDCGEACLSSIMEVHTTLHMPPGCIRQMLGKSEIDGRTTAPELANFLRCFDIGANVLALDDSAAWDSLGYLRHHGHYAAVLGYWISPDALHWELAYQRSGETVLTNDSWTGSRMQTNQHRFKALYANEIVGVPLTVG